MEAPAITGIGPRGIDPRGWEAFVASADHAIDSAVTLGCEVVLVGAIFYILAGIVVYLTRYNNKGSTMIIKGVLVAIVATSIYAWVLGTNGAPDVSIWFKLPA